MSTFIKLTARATLGVALVAISFGAASADSDRVAWLKSLQQQREAQVAPTQSAGASASPVARAATPTTRAGLASSAASPVQTARVAYRSVTIGGRIIPQPLTVEENRARATAVRTAGLAPGGGVPQMDPKFLPADVSYTGGYKPGTIVIDTEEKYLYHVLPGGTARRYGVGVGRPGFQWAGTHHVSMKREWPGWTPPAQMRKRQPELPAFMEGGPGNPLGARAMYLGSSLYRIHGSNAPWTIGTEVSSGCIRMRNEDVTELYDQVKVGTTVVVLR